MTDIVEKIFFLLPLAFFAALVVILNQKYPMLHDAPTTQNPSRSTTSYSLGRVQMAFWTVLTISSLFWVLGVWLYEQVLKNSTTDGFNGAFDLHVVALLGISGATGVVSAGVDAQKDSMVETATASMRANSTTIVNLSRQIAGLLPAVAGPAKGAGVAQGLAQQNIDNLRNQRAKASGDMARPAVVVARNRRKGTADGFFSDLLTDENGNSLHRLQMILFTLAYGLYFCIVVVGRKSCDVQITDQEVALMGVSSLIYVGFKIPGRTPGT